MTYVATLAGMLIVFATPAFGTAGPGDAVQDFMDALRTGDGETVVSLLSQETMDSIEEAYSMIMAVDDPESIASSMGLTIEGDIEEMDFQEFAVAFFEMPAFRTLEMVDFQVENVTIDGDEAEVEITGTLMGETRTDILNSVREDGDWKVYLN